jgi:hypothetical protein
MTSKGGESPGVLEIDAIGVDEWEHEQHTPRAMDENLAALVKQSTTQGNSGPARAPTVEDGWEADATAAAAELAKPRTTTNTVVRPAPPKAKTMALPTVAVVPPKPAARAETKAIGSKQTPAKPHVADEAPPGFVEVKPRAARGPATPKPAAKPTPPPMAAISTEPKPVAKPAAKPTPPPMAALAPRAPRPSAEPEGWDSSRSGATSVGNRVAPSRPVWTDFAPEDSVIVNLDAKPSADKPRRPQTYPVIQTSSERNASTSGAFVMPTAAHPNAQVATERASAPELPPPPVAVVGASPLPDDDRASSPVWHTPLPGDASAAPAAPSWPSASGLVYKPIEPLADADEPAVSLKRAPLAALLPFVRSRGFVIAIAGAAVLAIVVAISSRGSHESKHAPVVAPSTSKPAPIASNDSSSTHTPAAAMPAPTPSAAVEPVAPSPKSPVKKPIATRRIMRNRKPVVVDYDKHPSSPAAGGDQALAQARDAYSIGNQHLFAGENREAITAYRRALSIYPSYAAGYRGLGLAFAELDDKPAALAAFKTYVKLAPTAKDVALIKKRIRSLSVR